MIDGLTEGELNWVLVLAPFRRDADYIAALLREQKLGFHLASGDDDLVRSLGMVPGVVVVTHEALGSGTVARIGDHVRAQPDWSEVPIVVLLEKAAQLVKIRDHLQASWPGSRLLFHTRPVAALELVNVINSNLLVRLRQRQVRDALERERELRLELNHRVKNILASVTSIFHMTQGSAASVDDLANDFKGRLRALSDVHAAVFEAGGEEVSLSAIVGMTVSPYNTDGLNRIIVNGPDILVNRQAGTTIALCLHELATNAIKYGALSHLEGKVNLLWQIAGDSVPMLTLEWHETGGPATQPPTRQGYGTRYVRSALGSLFGTVPELTFAAEGFQCRITGLLSRIAVQTEPQ
jgi:two-component sensor histidine kinase